MTESSWEQAEQRAVEALSALKGAAEGAKEPTVITISDLKRIDVRDGDVFVLLAKDDWSLAQRAAVQQMLTEELGHPVVVIPSDMDLAVIRREQLDAESG